MAIWGSANGTELSIPKEQNIFQLLFASGLAWFQSKSALIQLHFACEQATTWLTTMKPTLLKQWSVNYSPPGWNSMLNLPLPLTAVTDASFYVKESGEAWDETCRSHFLSNCCSRNIYRKAQVIPFEYVGWSMVSCIPLHIVYQSLFKVGVCFPRTECFTTFVPTKHGNQEQRWLPPTSAT